MNILFGDLKREYSEISDRIDYAVKNVLNKGWFVLGEELSTFEKRFSEYIGTKYAAGCASGTDAITLALSALEHSDKTEVIVQTNTCVPTICGIINAGLKPVFCDVEDESLMMKINDAENKINENTLAIMPVHLYGASADMKQLSELSKKYNIYLVEDCAQSHGSQLDDKNTGTFGSMSCFSFYPSKNLGCYGDGGAVLTNDDIFYERLLKLRNYGQEKRYYHITYGYNSRLDEIQAAILNVKLNYLDEWNNMRKRIAKIYDDSFNKGSFIKPLKFNSDVSSVYHLYVIKSEHREELQKYLYENGIATLIHYPIPCHLQKSFEYLKYKSGDFPVSEKNATKILSLPLYPQLKNEEIDYIINTINSFYER